MSEVQKQLKLEISRALSLRYALDEANVAASLIYEHQSEDGCISTVENVENCFIELLKSLEIEDEAKKAYLKENKNANW